MQMNYKQLVNTVLDAKTNDYPNRRFKLTELLGFGSEGGAYLATAYEWGTNPQQVVIKIQKNLKPNEKKFLIDLIEYQNLYENGNQPNQSPSYLIKLYGYFESQQQNCVIMEVGKESLFDYINQNQYQNVSIQQKEKICFQITQPIHFLHQQKLIHRDIKPENYIKVGDDFKLIDFGLIKSSISENKTVQVGSGIFRAPEIVENSNSYTEKVDVWSLACVFYEILTTQALFDGQDMKEVTNNIKNHKDQPQVVNNKINKLQTSQKVKEIIIKMLTYAEKDRPSIQWVEQEFQNYFNGFKPSPPLILTFPTSNDVLKNKQEFIKSTQNDYQNQIETLKQTISQKEKQQQDQNLKLKKEYETNLSEFKQVYLKEIDSLKQERLKNEKLMDEKLKQIDAKLKEQQTKIEEQGKIYIKKQDLDIESNNTKKVIALEQQKIIEQQESAKTEIYNQNTQMQSQFNNQMDEIKQEFYTQLNQLKIDQKEELQDNLKEKQLIFEQFNKYTSMIVQDLKHLQVNNDTENNHNEQQQTQDQQSFIQERTSQQSNDQLSLNQESECYNSQANTQNLNQSTIQEYKNLFENFRTLLKQIKDIFIAQANKLNLNNQVFIDEKKEQIVKKELIEKKIQLENSNQELKKKLEDLSKQLEDSNYRLKKYNRQNAEEKQKIEKQNAEEKSKLVKQIDDLNKKVKQLEEKDQKQEIVNQNLKLSPVKLNEANQPLSQVNALIKFFKDKSNVKEFQEQYNKEFSDLLTCINDTC